MVNHRLIKIYPDDFERLDLVREVLIKNHPDLELLQLSNGFIVKQMIDFILDNAKLLK